jgi:ubiquinone/menaquinone biosynthesis C-methylase UbiE
MSIISDAKDMKEISDNSIDVILIIFALHHINGKKYSSAISSLKKVIKKSNRKLTKNGEIIIVELTLNNIFFFIERLSYKLIYYILKMLKTDMVFFYNDKTIVNSLLEISINSKIVIKKIKMNGWLDPLLGTFPGIIKIPAFLMPTSMKVFRLKK